MQRKCVVSGVVFVTEDRLMCRIFTAREILLLTVMDKEFVYCEVRTEFLTAK